MGYGSLAPVQIGWTGSIAVTVGSTTTTITPRTRESVASLLARLVTDAFVELTLSLTLSVSSSGVITITGDATFTLNAGGAAATYTGFTGSPYSGARAYTAAGAYDSGYVPTVGLRLDGSTLSTEAGRHVSTGATGAVTRTSRCQ